MKVYLIDDLPQKHKSFYKVLDLANELSQERALDIRFEPGFGNNVDNCIQASRNPDCLFNALMESDSIYLIDLDLREKDLGDIAGNLEQKLADSGIEWGKHAIQDRRNLKDSGGNPQISSVAGRYELAFLLLLAIKFSGRKPLCASNVGTVRDVKVLVDQELFPEITSFPDEINENETHEWAERVIGCCDTLLYSIEKNTRNWFSVEWDTGDNSSAVLPHDFERLSRSFPTFEKKVARHKSIVRGLFRRAPDRWWQNPKAVNAFHLNLKYTVGTHVQWMNGSEKPLGLGGAYLIFLLILERKWNARIDDFLIDDWGCFCRSDGKDGFEVLPFLPEQAPVDAKRSVKALHDFFVEIIMKKDGKTLGVQRIEGPSERSPHFGVKLNWSMEELTGFSSALGKKVNEGFDAGILALPTGKAVDALLRFAIASQVRKSGAGPLGTIRIENDHNSDLEERGWLQIGGFGGTAR
jgi:hypothetical protein